MLLDQADKYVWQLEQEVQHRAFHHNVMLQQLAEEEARSAALRRDRDTLLAQNSGLQGLLEYTRGGGGGTVSGQRQPLSAPSSSSASSTSSPPLEKREETPPAPSAAPVGPRLPPAVASVYTSLQSAATPPPPLPPSASPPAAAAAAAASSSPPSLPHAAPSTPQTTMTSATAAQSGNGTTISATEEVLRHVLLEREAALQGQRGHAADPTRASAATSSLVQSPSSPTPHAAVSGSYNDDLRRYLDRLIQEGEAEAVACRQAASVDSASASPVSVPSYASPPAQSGSALPGNFTYPRQHPQPSAEQLAFERQRESEVQQLRAAIASERDRFTANTRRWNAHVKQQQEQQQASVQQLRERQRLEQLRAEAAAEEARLRAETARWRSYALQHQ